MPWQIENRSYKRYIYYKIKFIVFIAFMTLLTAILAVSIGSMKISLRDTFWALMGNGTERANIIVWNIRMPRIITAMVSGFGLAAAGCVMQCILKNPLASSSTLGVSQGAAFGASMAIIYFGAGFQGQISNGITIINPYLVTLCAFLSSMLSVIVILGLASVRRITPEGIILSGVALTSLFSGGTTLLQYFADDVEIAAVVFWTFGDLGRTSWQEIIFMTAIVISSFIYFLYNCWNYNVMEFGEQSAKSLGVNVEHTRLFSMLVCALTAAGIISFVGIINFVGLIAPHIVRRFIGNDHRFLIPASALFGALILLVGDVMARIVLAPTILPIGAITSFLGAPVFLYLLFKGVSNR